MTATITARLLATTALLTLAACASGGGGGPDNAAAPEPINDPVTGTPAAPRNLVNETISFRSGSERRQYDETYDLSVRTLLVDEADNGARTFSENAATDFGSGQSMRFDADTEQFTFDIDYTTDGGTRIAMSETFGPMLLMTPKDLDDLQNDLNAVYLATQSAYYAVDPDYIQGDVYRADDYVSSLVAASDERSGLGNIARWREIAGDTGVVEPAGAEEGRALGSLPILVAQDPDRFGAPGTLRGNLGSSREYLAGLDRGDFINAQDRVPGFGAAQDDYLATLIGFSPEAFGVDRNVIVNGLSPTVLIEAMYETGGVQVGALLDQVQEATQQIGNEPGFFYSSGDTNYYQYRTDETVAPTRFVAAGEWYQTGEDGKQQFGHLVFGQRTDPQEMPDTGTASYEGTIYGTLQRQNTVEQLRGGFDMETDFASGAVTVGMDANIAYRDTDEQTVYIDYAEFDGAGSIDGASFGGVMEGTVDRDVTDGTDVLRGSFDGHFFGPTAQEIGGTFEFSGDDAAAAGAFVGADPNSNETGD